MGTLIAILLGALVFFGLHALCIWSDVKADRKERAKVEGEMKAWLDAEKAKKGRFFVSFQTVDDEHYRTNLFHPRAELTCFMGHYGFDEFTSEGLAECEMARSFKRGYFIDEIGSHIPVSRIAIANVVRSQV